MSFKQVYIPVCTGCNTEGKYDYEKKIPEQWAGFIQSGNCELKYVYGKEGWRSEDGSSRSVSTSCYIPQDSIFCSFECFSGFMQERIKVIGGSMKEKINAQ